MIVHQGNDIDYEEAVALIQGLRLVTQVVFLLNITKVGNYACSLAVHLVIVEIPEGVERIGDAAFQGCSNLTTVSFPTSITTIVLNAFLSCVSLDNVDTISLTKNFPCSLSSIPFTLVLFPFPFPFPFPIPVPVFFELG